MFFYMKPKAVGSRSFSFAKSFICLAIIVIVLLTIYELLPAQQPILANPGLVFENAELRVEQIAEIPRRNISFINNDTLYAYEDHFIYRKKNNSKNLDELGVLPKIRADALTLAKDFVARLKITRLLRDNLPVFDIILLDSGTMLVFYDHIYRSTDGGKTFQSVFSFRDNKIYNPFPLSIASDRSGNIFFGEYTCHIRPHEVKIIRGYDDGQRWEVFYTFESGKIFHVHSIEYDRYRDRFWVCTGDRDDESYLMYFDINNNEVVTVGGGDQGWRIVSLMIAKDCLVWCSDNVETASYVYKFDLVNNRREKVFKVGKPGYYSTVLKDGSFVFSTAFEYRAPYTHNEKPEPSADIWISKNAVDWYKIASFRERNGVRHRDLMRPQIFFPAGNNSSGRLYFTPIMTSVFSNEIIAYKIHWKNK